MDIFGILTLISALFSVGVKVVLTLILVPLGLRLKHTPRSLLLLLGVLISSLFGDISWAAKLIRSLHLVTLPYPSLVFLIRIGWAFMVVQYQLLALFIEHLSQKNFRPRIPHYLLFAVSSAFFFYFLGMAFLGLPPIEATYRAVAISAPFFDTILEVQIMRIVAWYLISCFMVPGLYLACKSITRSELPKILRSQFSILAKFFVVPYLASELFEAFRTLTFGRLLPGPLAAASTFILTLALLYCFRQLFLLRFLNFSPTVKALPRNPTIDEFKLVLEQLSHATSLQELGHISQTFFKESFNIPLRDTHLYLRTTHAPSHEMHSPGQAIESTVEQFLYLEDTTAHKAMTESRILIYDETEFSNFYHETECDKELIAFLDAIDADIFLPVYAQHTLVAYIVVARDARDRECYGKLEQDQMRIFADYLGSIINLIQNKNTEVLLKQSRKLSNQLIETEAFCQQYGESVRSFIDPEKATLTGVLNYKNRRFHLKNSAARQLIDVDPNQQSGHPLSRALRTLIQQVSMYRSPQQILVRNDAGEQIVLRGSQNLENNSTIITVSYPTIADVLSDLTSHLHDQESWNLCLYLKTTRIGTLIDQFLPGTSEPLLQCKLSLLRHALSKQSALLCADPEDVSLVASLLHNTTQREILRFISPETADVGLSLFGVTPSIAPKKEEHPLLEQLSETGTICITNIEFLAPATQVHLTEYLQTGLFRHLKSEVRTSSNAYIICACSRNPQTLVEEGVLSNQLYDALKAHTIMLPRPNQLPRASFDELADGLCEQIIHTNTLRNFLLLSPHDKERLFRTHPESISLLKERIQRLLLDRSKKSHLTDEACVTPAYQVEDPDLLEAVRLGRQALRDREMVIMLWNKFKNQNKIATLLGVNRSSVNRRIKEYGLQ